MRQVTRYSRFRQVRGRGPVPLASNEKRPDQRSGRFRDETEPGGLLLSRGFSPTPAEQAIAIATSNPIGLATNIRDKQPCDLCFFPEPSP
jgi:hypothetical protein